MRKLVLIFSVVTILAIAGFFINIPKIFATPVTLVAFDPNALNGDEATFNSTTNDANLNTSVLSRGAGITAWPLLHGFSSKDFVTNGTKTLAISNNEYYQVSINAKTNYKVSLSSLDANLRKSSTGANTYQWQYSLDNFATSGIDVGLQGTLGAGDDGLAMAQIDLSSIANLQNVTAGDTIVFRLYGWGASGAGGTFAIGRRDGDDLVFRGNVNLVTHTLTYTASANGSIAGTTPQTINHGADGTEVIATPDANYHFVNWSDGITTAARIDTNITADISATANFEIDTHTLTYTASANGSIAGTTPQTIDHGSNGTEVIATPDANYHFANWSDGITTAARIDTNITADISATANFEIDTHTLTYTASANGSIAGTTPQTINHGSNGTEVTAVADSNYHFTSWSDGSTTNPRTDTNITADISATANFAINNTGEGGSACCGAGGGGGGGSIGSSSENQYVALTPPPAVVQPAVIVPPPVIIQPEIQQAPEPQPELSPEISVLVAPPIISRNTVPAPALETEELAPEPIVSQETSQSVATEPVKNNLFLASITNVGSWVGSIFSAFGNLFKIFKWW